jgi:hypothetical protein
VREFVLLFRTFQLLLIILMSFLSRCEDDVGCVLILKGHERTTIHLMRGGKLHMEELLQSFLRSASFLACIDASMFVLGLGVVMCTQAILIDLEIRLMTANNGNYGQSEAKQVPSCSKHARFSDALAGTTGIAQFGVPFHCRPGYNVFLFFQPLLC